MVLVDNKNNKSIAKYVTICMKTTLWNNAAVPVELREVMMSCIFHAASKNLFKPKTIAKHFNCLHHSMRFADCTFSEDSRRKYLEMISGLPADLIRHLTLNSRVVQIIAVNATERQTFFNHIKNIISDEDYWTTHVCVLDMFYQILNDEIDFELIDSKIQNITNINMTVSKYLSIIVYKIMKHYFHADQTEKANSLYNFVRLKLTV